MQCSNCGNQIPDTARVCGYCGYKLQADSQSMHSSPATERKGIPGWAWGLGSFCVILIVGGLLFASGIPGIPGNQEGINNRPTSLPAAPQPSLNEVLKPTETALPLSTSVIEPTTEVQTSVKVLISDHFSDTASGWTTGSDGSIDGGYYNEGYRMSLTGKYSWAYHQYLEGDPQGNFNDFTLEADVTPQTEFGYAGLVFRRSAPFNFYAFEVSPEGKFRLVRADQAEQESWKILFDWTPSRILAQGLNVNHLEIITSEDQISLYANGQFLASVNDNTYRSGWIGLYVARTGLDFQNGRTADYFFDNVRMTYP